MRSAATQPNAANARAVEEPKDDHDERAADTRVQFGAGDQPQQDVHERLQHAQRHRADKQPGDQHVARRSGVSARRLKKPLSMSSARLVPVLICANVAPWMNATAIANDT